MKIRNNSLFGTSMEAAAIWADVEGFPNYEVNKSGVIRSKVGKKVRKTYLDKDGYIEVVLFKDGLRYYVKLHRIVAIAHVPRIDGKDYVNHKNKHRDDPRAVNLEWVTHAENMIHMAKYKQRQRAKKTLKETFSNGEDND